MGFVGDIIGGVGSIIGSNAQADAAEAAAEASLTGFNYLTEGPGAPAMQGFIDAGQAAIPAQQTTQNVQAQLLGLPAPYMTEAQPAAGSGGGGGGPFPEEVGNFFAGFGELAGMPQGVQDTLRGGEGGHRVNVPNQGGFPNSLAEKANAAAGAVSAAQGGGGEGQPAQPVGGVGAEGAKSAFDTYRDSTGYQFRRDQGTEAINANVGAAGLRHSGGTMKALQEHGQNIGSQEFGNYLNQLSGLNAQQGGMAQAGQNALGQIGSVGSTAGGGAANALIQGGNAQAGGIAGAASNFGNALSGAMNQFGGGGRNFGGNSLSPAASRAMASGGGGLY